VLVESGEGSVESGSAGGEWRGQCRVGQCWWRVERAVQSRAVLVESAELAWEVVAGSGCEDGVGCMFL